MTFPSAKKKKAGKISRQLKWQRKQRAAGLCWLCSSPTGGFVLCAAHRAKARAYYLNNKDKQMARVKAWHAKHPGYATKYSAAWRKKNPSYHAEWRRKRMEAA